MGSAPVRRHDVRDGSGRFAPKPAAAESPRANHTTSTYGAAQIKAADYRPHRPGQVVTETAGVQPDTAAGRQAAPDVSPGVPHAGGSPTGYGPYTMGTC